MSSLVPVVKDFMSSDVKAVRLNTPVTVAVGLMVEFNIGCVVVVDDSGPVGVLTERDLLANVLQQSLRPEAPLIHELLKAQTVTVRADETLHEAALKILAKRSRLLVLDDQGLIGIVTVTDLVTAIQRLGRHFSLGEVVSKKVRGVSPETSVGIAVQMMAEKRIGSVLVGRGRPPVGIFTERDLLKKVIAKNLRLSTKVDEVASRPLIASTVDIDGLQAAEAMRKNGIKRLPLFDGERLVGIVTARDVVEAFANAG